MSACAGKCVFMILSRDWAIGHDKLQWILYQRRKRREEWYWNPFGYVTTKAIIVRVLREKRVQLDDPAWNAIEELPGSFREWHSTHTTGL